MSRAYDVCERLLPGVSRTFALLIPELPGGLREPVCCAYLLCRVADTIEDAPGVPIESRLACFDRLETAVRDDSRAPAALASLREATSAWPLDADHARLMDEVATVLEACRAFPAGDQVVISECVLEMVDGMRQTVRAQAGEARHGFRDVADLDRYCYYVAGIVGRMLTRLYWRHVHGEGSLPPESLVQQGIEFGLGLQLTNVLKDYRADLRRGVCFLPISLASGLNVRDQIGRDQAPPHPLRVWLAGHAAGWLDTAFAYVLAWPATAVGIRVFCLGALFMAVRTLGVVLTAGALDATESPKITREDVAEIMRTARAEAADDERLRLWYRRERARLDGLLAGAPEAVPGGRQARSEGSVTGAQ